MARNDFARLFRIAKRKAIIRRKGFTYKDLGNPTAISLAIGEQRPSPAIRRHIVRKLRMRYQDFWGRPSGK